VSDNKGGFKEWSEFDGVFVTCDISHGRPEHLEDEDLSELLADLYALQNWVSERQRLVILEQKRREVSA